MHILYNMHCLYQLYMYVYTIYRDALTPTGGHCAPYIYISLHVRAKRVKNVLVCECLD